MGARNKILLCQTFDALKTGPQRKFANFGKFERKTVRKRGAREGLRAFYYGETIFIEPRLNASSALREVPVLPYSKPTSSELRTQGEMSKEQASG